MEERICLHMKAVTEIREPKGYVCEECVKIHSQWLHLRTCQTCGVTLCCDDSPNKHMTKHFHATGHPVVISAEPGESWMYCYVDKTIAEINLQS